MYLCFCEAEPGGDLVALGSGQILALLELGLQLEQLQRGVGGARLPALPEHRVVVTCRGAIVEKYISDLNIQKIRMVHGMLNNLNIH